MTANDFVKNNYDELSERAKRVIEGSDQSFNDWAGEFENVDEFNKFIELMFRGM